jgi:uncharacterized membrane protein YsdA (DUF1294 family)/cold shock CspA family protein
MRLDGTLTSWNDDRGFGFIAPAQGGQDIFLHISAFPRGAGRPVPGQRLTFEVGLNAEGKKQARRVDLLALPTPAQRRMAARNQQREAPVPWTLASGAVLPAFAVLCAVVAFRWGLPVPVLVAYGVASVVCFLAYAFDKSAATAGRWRTSERMLLLLGLVGGWPGGLLAQHLLRHKTAKPAFRAAFWATVALNVAGLLVMTTPLLSGWSGGWLRPV